MITNEERVVAQMTGVTRIFGDGASAVRAVDGVDLTVRAGEMILIMGPSGSGKTTLLMMLGGLLRPTSGNIVVDGVEITSLRQSKLTPLRRKNIGFVFQSFNLWNALNVQENVEAVLNMSGMSGPPARQRARTLLEGRGLGNRLRFRSRDLSGGEKQRVSIARALANEPLLLLADEPTANLDSKHGRDVMQLLRGISRESGRAVVVVSHDQRIREVADRVLWLEDGRIMDIGRMVRDPVCGMSVESENAVSAQQGGTTYYFCSQGCQREFAESPETFVAADTTTSNV